MQKMICIKRTEKYEHHKKLQLYKEYQVEDVKSGFSVYLDGVSLGFYPKEFFADIQEWRNIQINKILD